MASADSKSGRIGNLLPDNRAFGRPLLFPLPRFCLVCKQCNFQQRKGLENHSRIILSISTEITCFKVPSISLVGFRKQYSSIFLGMVLFDFFSLTFFNLIKFVTFRLFEDLKYLIFLKILQFCEQFIIPSVLRHTHNTLLKQENPFEICQCRNNVKTSPVIRRKT